MGTLNSFKFQMKLNSTFVLFLMAFLGISAQGLPTLPNCHKTDPQGFFFFKENTVPMGAMFGTFRNNMLNHNLESVTVTKLDRQYARNGPCSVPTDL